MKTKSAAFIALTLLLLAASVGSNLALGGEIHTAASSGDVQKVKALLAGNPDLVSSQDEHGWTPLHWAATSGHKEVAELLIANKADVNAFNQNSTPLLAAILNHHQDVVDLLIASNAQVTIFDAAAGGYIEIVKTQLKADPSLVSATDGNGWTALHWGARNGHLDVEKLLLANKADANAKDNGGMTPLQMAFAFSGTARPAANQEGSTAADYEGIAELLIAHGADVTSRNRSGMTVLHYAAISGFTNLIRELLDRHADVNAKDSNGRTPLDLAAQHNHMDVVEMLVERGADMDAEDKAGLLTLKEAQKRVQTRSASSAYEYEADGQVMQTIMRQNSTNLSATASFTVYVRDGSWLIATTETNEAGTIIAREIGSTNGTEIYECTHGLVGSGPMMGQIESGVVPIGEQDSAVVGHLWLMFASQCYWPGLNSDQLVPVYDWQASALAGGQNRRMSADWELLPGTNSLPHEVRYLDTLNHTNAIYTATGTNSAGGMLLPDGFVFKHFNGDRLDKIVEVEVTAIRPVCSRVILIPLPGKGTSVVDARFDSGVPNRPPSYQNPVFGQWLSIEESKKLAGINKTNDLRNLARAGISPFPATRSPSRETNVGPPLLSLSIRCTNDVVKAGDEIDIEFRITNRGTNNYQYSDRTYDRSGRMSEYKLVATNSSSKAISDPRANDKGFWMGGGLFQYATLKPSESFTKIIPLNRWALVKEAGQYEVTGTYVSSSFDTNCVTIHSDPIKITVQPRTPEEMDAYIGDLTNQLEAKLTGKLNPAANESRPPDPAMNELVTKLMFTCSPKIVPSLLDSMCDYGSGGGFWEHEAIMFYVPHSEETKHVILAFANARGLGSSWTLGSLLRELDFSKEELKPSIERALAPDNEPSWGIGAELAQKFGGDAFTERLAAIAALPRSNARLAAITALAAHRTDAGVKALKSLLDDPHQNVWTTLAFALENGERDGILRPDDFSSEDVKPLIRRFLAAGRNTSEIVTGVGLLENFGSDEFTPQLIALVNDPGNWAWQEAVYALALNRTDDGVKTLKSLLASTNQTAAEAIRYAYTNQLHYRGRPLKPDDFNQEYQQPETRK